MLSGVLTHKRWRLPSIVSGRRTQVAIRLVESLKFGRREFLWLGKRELIVIIVIMFSCYKLTHATNFSLQL